MQKKILVLANDFGGLYSARKEVIEACIIAGYVVIISAASDEYEGYFREKGCSIISIEFKPRGMNPFADFGLMIRYCKLIMKIKPLVVLTYAIKPNVYGGIACRLSGVKQVANITGLGDAVENGGWLQKLTIVLYRIGVRKAQVVFFQNKGNMFFCMNHGISGLSAVLLPGSGVNLKIHSCQQYPKNENKIRFLFIGRMLKDKGVEEFFEMAQILKDKYPHVEFQMLGVPGLYKHRLDELAMAGIISYMGTTSDVRPYIGAVECTVMPSYHEGMSNVNLESAANGRPVITTNVPGCLETVDDGKTGFLIIPRSSHSLVAAVEKFIHLPYEEKVKMGIAGRKKVEQEFDRQVVVESYLATISQCDLTEN